MTPGQRLSSLAAKVRCEFAIKHHTSTKGQPLDFDKFYYLREVFADTSTDITLVCSVQSGKTEWVVVDALALISLGVSYQLVQPKDDLRVLFVRTRIDEPAERSPLYKANIKSVGKIYKWNKKGILRVTFSNREDEMISFPADVVGVDEVDRCNLDHLTLLPDRLLGSEFRLQRRSSTPTTEGNDSSKNIWFHYMNTDQKKYFQKCESCGTEQNVEWDKNYVQEKRDRDTGRLEGYSLMDEDWNENSENDIRPMCSQCSHPLNRLGVGKYYPTVYRPKSVWNRGYHFGKLLSPLVTVREIWGNYEESIHNPFQLQRFYNSILGLPYVGEGTKITANMLYSCTKGFTIQPKLDKSEYKTSMGVDVGPEYLDVRISSYPYPGKPIRRMVYADKVRSFTDLHELVARFSVQVCTIDAEPETRSSLDFQSSAKCAVYVCYTRDKAGYTLSELLLEKVKQTKRMTIDRTIMMDCVLETYAKRQHELPKNITFLSNQCYINEMTNPTRVLEVDNKGKEKFAWTSGADHCFMADMYDYCSMLLGSFHTSSAFMLSGKRNIAMVSKPISIAVDEIMS